MRCHRRTLPSTLAAGLLLALAAPARAQDEAPGPPPPKPYRVGVKVPPLRLPDLAGKEVTLVDEESEHVTVLVFWSLRDPIARRYLPGLESIRRDYEEKGVKLFLVDSNRDELTSGAEDPLDRLREFVREEEVRIPLLIDMRNVLADDFGAVSANHCFVIGATRRLAYMGAIDDDPHGKLARAKRPVRPFLRDALDAVLRGETPPETWTRPQGRPIKRWPAAAEEDG